MKILLADKQDITRAGLTYVIERKWKGLRLSMWKTRRS